MRKIILLAVLATFTVGSVMAQTESKNDSVPAKTEKTEKKKSKFGSFLKKVGEKTTGINMTDEPFIVNPNPAAFDAEFIGAYGNSAEGRVTIAFRVKTKIVVSQASFGGSVGGTGESIAYDTKGKTFKQHSGDPVRVDAAKGVWTEVKLDGFKSSFENVPADLKAFELIKVSFYFSAKDRGILELRNIPIQWDATPAE
jgi:hypothetical protein